MAQKSKKPLFTIDKDENGKDIVIVASGDGHLYCTTTPDHPYGESRSDRKKKYVYYARAKMELHIGRFLEENEEVHHKDEDPSNNAISNLVLTNKEDHARDHSKKKKFWKKSPENKPSKKKKSAALRVAHAWLAISCTE
jgi:hypothetical protein